MKWVLALAMALGLGAGARAQANPPLTLGELFTVTPQEAAARVFGRTPEVFLERSPWNGLRPNFVLDTVGQFQMELFAEPERIAPTVCAVTMGWAVFDMRLPKDATDEDKAAWTKLGYSQRPLRLDRWNRKRQYFVAGPAPPTPLQPGGKPASPGNEALAKDSCANPVAARGRFEAPSDETAILLVSKVTPAVAAAKRPGPLPFKLNGGCGRPGPMCRPRRVLSELKIGWMNRIDLDEGCKDWRGKGLVSGAQRCLWFDSADPLDPDAWWSFVLMLGKSDKLLKVYLGGRASVIP